MRLMKPGFAGLLAVALALLAGAGCTPMSPPGATLGAIDSAIPAQRSAVRAPPPPLPDAVRDAVLTPVASLIPESWLPEPRFDISVNDTPAAQVFMAMVTDTGYSMLLPRELPGKVTVQLRNVTVRDALEAMRELYGYEYRIDDRRIYVQSQGLQTRIFKVNYLSMRRLGQSDMRVSSGSLGAANPQANNQGVPGAVPGALPGAAVPGAYPGGTGPTGARTTGVEASRLMTSTDSDFWPAIQQSLQSIVGTEGGRSVVVNSQAGVIVVRATPPEQRQIAGFLKAMQLSIERQVMLEAKIIEVSLSEGFQSGVNWSAFDSLGRHRWSNGADNSAIGIDRSATGSLAQLLGSGITSATGRMANGAFGLGFQTGSFQALIQFLENQGHVHVLSSPRIATMNNQKAVLKVGTDDFFVTNISTSTVTSGAAATSSPSITVQPFFSGIALDVTPQIDENNSIILHMHPSVSVVTERTKQIDLGTLGNYTLPLASSSVNETDSIVRVTDGNIVAIGGLMSQQNSASRNNVPGTADVPVLNGFLGNRSAAMTKRELVILVKPTVIKTDDDWVEDLDRTRERMSAWRDAFGAGNRREPAGTPGSTR